MCLSLGLKKNGQMIHHLTVPESPGWGGGSKAPHPLAVHREGFGGLLVQVSARAVENASQLPANALAVGGITDHAEISPRNFLWAYFEDSPEVGRAALGAIPGLGFCLYLPSSPFLPEGIPRSLLCRYKGDL